MYDLVIGRFPSVDPIADQFAWVSPFNYAENRPIDGIDLYGLQYLRYDQVENIGNDLLTFYHNNYGLGFETVEYEGNQYYNLGFHLNDVEGNQITEWVYTSIAPVIASEDYVGYGDVTPSDCMGACKAQIDKQDLEIGSYYGVSRSEIS